jgi:ADP-ribose pyrophosphatase
MYYHPSINPGRVSQSSDAAPDGFDAAMHLNAEITTLARDFVFENTVFSVFADHIVDKKGHRVERYLSVVPKCLLDGVVAGVAVLPVKDGEFGLIRVFRHPIGRWSWEVVKGHVEQGEDAGSAALRELQEEAGFPAALADLVDLGAVSPEAGVIKARTRLFAVAVTEKNGKAADGELGHGEMVFYSRAEIDDLIARAQIEDASTLVILFKYMFNQNHSE